MIPQAHTIAVLSVTLTVAALGASPPGPSDAPVEAKSNHSVLSAASRLGIKFSPPPKDGEDALGASRVRTVIIPANVSPDAVVLSPFYVTEPRVKLTEKEILTDKGRLEVAQKQQLTPLYRKTFGPLSQLAAYYFNWPSILGGWHPNEVEAMTLYRQEERLKMLDEMDSLIRLETIYDAKETKEFRGIRFGADIVSR